MDSVKRPESKHFAAMIFLVYSIHVRVNNVYIHIILISADSGAVKKTALHKVTCFSKYANKQQCQLPTFDFKSTRQTKQLYTF